MLEAAREKVIHKTGFSSHRKTDKLDPVPISRTNVNSKNGEEKIGIRQRLKEEMRIYAIISLYLWICFTTLLLYQNSILRVNDLALLPLSSAAIKALILGKFILIGKAIKIGERVRHNVLLHRILWKSLATVLLLMIFAIAEDLLVGLVHGHAIADTMVEMTARSWVQWVEPNLLMLLLLIPLIGFEKIDASMGKGSLSRLLLGRSER